jgi:hypothetical protein
MSDWADEIASDLFYKGLTLKAIAAALRKARADGLGVADNEVLREISRIRDNELFPKTSWMAWTVDRLNNITNAIRALKETP